MLLLLLPRKSDLPAPAIATVGTHSPDRPQPHATSATQHPYTMHKRRGQGTHRALVPKKSSYQQPGKPTHPRGACDTANTSANAQPSQDDEASTLQHPLACPSGPRRPPAGAQRMCRPSGKGHPQARKEPSKGMDTLTAAMEHTNQGSASASQRCPHQRCELTSGDRLQSY